MCFQIAMVGISYTFTTALRSGYQCRLSVYAIVVLYTTDRLHIICTLFTQPLSIKGISLYYYHLHIITPVSPLYTYTKKMNVHYCLKTFFILLVFIHCNNGQSVTKLTNENIKDAVRVYTNVTSQNQAFNTFGDIKSWDVSGVTDMSYLFQDRDFNEDMDVSSWGKQLCFDLSII